MPLKVTFWGLPPPLSLTLNVPVRVPMAVGVKNTLMVQDAPTAKDEPQVWLCAKSPLVEMPEKANAVVPWLVTVTGLELLIVPTSWAAKVRLDGDKPTNVPTPMRLTLCGLLGSESEIVSTPVLVPIAAGLKVTLIVQLIPAPRLVPQLVVLK